ncbi:MAG TPA: efflux RND transporter periplasmic adaptor subunit [Fimbriimonadaceae bacterium]|nr:efflux RND transporter periplasmic adaptor subunit [Fimbriimonadaceae bacterium]
MAPSETPSHAPRQGKSRIWIILLLAAIVAGCGIAYYRSRNALPGNVIVASGSIEADETVIAPKIAGRLATLKVDEGDDVRRGQLLASLDDTELRAQLAQAEAILATDQAKLDEAVKGNRREQIDEARANLAAAESTRAGSERTYKTALRNVRKVTDLKAQVDAAAARLDASRAAYKQANDALALLLAGTRPDQIEQARAALEQAKIQQTQAEDHYERDSKLADAGAIPRQTAFDSGKARDAAVKATAQAQSHLKDLEAGARPEEVRQARMAVAIAQADLSGAKTALANARDAYQDRLAAQNQYDAATVGARVSAAQVDAARAQYNLMVAGSRPEDIESARGARDQATHAVAYARELVEDAQLFSPVDAVVKTKSSLPGEALQPGTPVVTLADLDHIWIRVFVPEDQYGKLRLGESVDVSVDSFPKEIFRGHIVSISSEAEFTPKNAQTAEERVKLVFGVKIMVENPGRRLKPGMPGDATIHVG